MNPCGFGFEKLVSDDWKKAKFLKSCTQARGLRNGDQINLHFWLVFFSSNFVKNTRRSLGYVCVFRLVTQKKY
jgi:hypothetical protein